MGIIRKESIRTTIFSYIGIMIGFISQTFIYTNLLTAPLIGLIRVLQSFGGLQAEVSQLGIQTITGRFFPYFRDKKKGHNGFLTLSLLFTTFGFVVVFIIILIFRGQIINWYSSQSPLFVQKYPYAFPIALSMVYITVFESYLRMLYKIIYAALVKEVYVRILSLGAVLLYAFNFINLEGFLVVFSAIYAFAALIMVIYLKMIGELFIKPDFSKITRSFWKEIRLYTQYTYVTMIVTRSQYEIDKLIVAAMSGLGATGIYSVAALMATVIAMPSNAIGNISIAFFSENLKNNDIEKVREVYHKTSLNQFIASALLFLLIWCNVDEMFSFMPAEFQEGKWIIFFIGVSKLIDSFCMNSSSIILFSKYYLFMMFSGTLTLVFLIVTNIYFIDQMGITGAALSILLSVILNNLMKVGFTWYKMKIHPFNKDLFLAFAIFGLCFTVFHFIPSFLHPVLEIGFRVILITVVYLLLILVFRVSDDITKLLREILNKLKKLS